ncbi:MAG: tRNA (N(6)-L-threonylcarbamoyladenosine(37)-C(2))-methylthiotransferase MtaB [Clostridia bacterium]|jgi:threonylcarbamoyladenosine tRNA methylthiotransferase MtaB|nr:tRNA (N(6)-L-threonylcarbamoyladenosine(37)-C(2))-methylthiotransferase MtaB [Clostridia bacterium]
MREIPRIAFYTLGCKVNQNETEAFSGQFREKGYEIVDFTAEADVYIINTCTVTHLADRKSRQMIRRALKVNPQAQIVVTGCYAQTDAEAIRKIAGVSLIVGTNEKSRLVELVEDLLKGKLLKGKEQETTINKPAPQIFVRKYQQGQEFEEIKLEKSIERSRAYLKVQEGCDQFCSYCIIPYARGPVRSRSLESTLAEAERLIKAGFREIVLLGIHLGAYGRDLGEGENLVYLLKHLLPLTEQVRWRLGSLEPVEVSPELLDLMLGYRNFCPHLHLPLQSGHDKILKAMNRPYTTEQYLEIITDIRKKIPDIALTTDIMVGFPGETDEHFQEYLKFVEKVAFSRLHVFKYSPRRGTPAASFSGQISPAVKEARSRKMIRLGEKLAKLYAQKFLGQTLDVLVEEKVAEHTWEGSSANYLKVRFNSDEAPRGQIIPIYLKKVEKNYCFGDVFQLQ